MISVELAQRIADDAQQLGLGEETITALRSNYPDVHFTYCMDDDIVTGKPVLSCSGFNVYLVDGREHCLVLTNDHDVATGVVLAEVLDDEED